MPCPALEPLSCTWNVNIPSPEDLFTAGAPVVFRTGSLSCPSGLRRDPIQIELLMCRGKVATRADLEDGLVVNGPRIEVYDGTSTAYDSGSLPRKRWNGLGDGAWIVEEARRFSEQNGPHLSLGDYVAGLNASLGRSLERFGYDTSDGGSLPGMAGVILQLAPRGLGGVAQWGDGLFVVKDKDGSVRALPSQSYREDAEIERPCMVRLLQECGGSRERAWEIFPGELRIFRRESVNRSDSSTGYGCLNGQASFLRFVRYETLDLAKVDWIFVGTDGAVPFEVTEDPEKLAAYVVEAVGKGGLHTIAASGTGAHNPFTSGPEITAMLLKF